MLTQLTQYLTSEIQVSNVSLLIPRLTFEMIVKAPKNPPLIFSGCLRQGHGSYSSKKLTKPNTLLTLLDNVHLRECIHQPLALSLEMICRPVMVSSSFLGPCALF